MTEELAGNTIPNTKRTLPVEAEPYKWQPGQSGNPSGRPKKKPITELYEQIMDDPANVDLIKSSIIKALGRSQMAMVLQVREMTDRLEGKITQPIEATVTMNLAEAIAEGRKRVAARREGK